MVVADYYGAVHVSDPLAARRCFVYSPRLRKHPYPPLPALLDNHQFHHFLGYPSFQTLNGVLSLFLVFDDPALTLPPWNQMRMRLLEPLGYGRLLKYPLYLHQQRASWRCLSLPTIREQCCRLRIKERLRSINLSDYPNLRLNSERH